MALPFNRTRIIFFAAVFALVLVIYFFIHAGEQSTDDAALEAHIMTISPKVSGYVKAIHIEDNKLVKAGDVMIEIDPTDYEIKRDHARAALESAEAAFKASSHNLDTTKISAPSSLEAATAEVDAAEANWKKAAADLKRMKALSKEARSREQLDAAIAAEKTALSTVEDAKAKLRSAKTAPKLIASAKSSSDNLAAQVKQAKADLAQAEQDLANTKIIAPHDGKITKRSVELGDYVQSAQQLGYVVGAEQWVIANFKETQLKHMRAGDKAVITVDAFSSLKLQGKVDSIQAGTGARFSTFPPENATGNFVKIVQRVPVKILLDSQIDPSLPAGAGMSVIATVYTQ
jgi:membrane fusion protein, multidrug efflux system